MPVVLYRAADETARVELLRFDEHIWATQAQMAELFQTSVANINTHLRNIFAEGELDPAASIKSYLIDQVQRKSTVRREVRHYDLAVVLAVGYRVRSPRGTEFRQWATEHLREYLTKGFVLDDRRLKHPGMVDYFDELLARIRDIRASEQRMYLRLRDIMKLAADYQPSDAATIELFQVVQNKLHFAVTGKTAPELIADRADHTQPNMGLTSWKGELVRKADVTVAKNFLREDEITELNRIVVMFLDFAEDQALRKKQVFLRLAHQARRVSAFQRATRVARRRTGVARRRRPPRRDRVRAVRGAPTRGRRGRGWRGLAARAHDCSQDSPQDRSVGEGPGQGASSACKQPEPAVAARADRQRSSHGTRERHSDVHLRPADLVWRQMRPRRRGARTEGDVPPLEPHRIYGLACDPRLHERLAKQ